MIMFRLGNYRFGFGWNLRKARQSPYWPLMQEQVLAQWWFWQRVKRAQFWLLAIFAVVLVIIAKIFYRG